MLWHITLHLMAPKAGVLLTLLAAFCLAVFVRAAEEQLVESYWRRGSASWYGNQEGRFVAQFAPYRVGGKSAFGIIEYGGCGLSNGDGTVQWPREQIASYADQNPDYPGACNRCYEVKCSPGDVLGWKDQPVPYKGNYFEFWEYVPDVLDDQGRHFPGNPGQNNATKTVTVSCWGDNSVVVKIVDLCPCFYHPAGEEPRFQYSCCYNTQESPKAGQWTFDLSYWAFQQLAHPEYGIMMVDFRAVDCDTHQPIRLEPGFISDTLYSGRPGVGWAWFPTGQINNNWQVVAPGQGMNGSAAACAQMRANEGGMTWACRGCGAEGYQPFAGAKAIEFWIRDKAHPGTIPNVKMQIGNPDYGKWCNSEPLLRDIKPSSQAGDWYKFVVDIGTFNCPNITSASQVAFNPQEQEEFCIEQLKIDK